MGVYQMTRRSGKRVKTTHLFPCSGTGSISTCEEPTLPVSESSCTVVTQLSYPPSKLGSLGTHVYTHTNTHVYMLFRLSWEMLWKTMIISDRRIYFIYAFCLYVSVLPWRKPGAHRRRGETVRMPVFSCIRDFAYASVFLHQLPHAVATATGASALRLQMLTSADIRKMAPRKPVRTFR